MKKNLYFLPFWLIMLLHALPGRAQYAAAIQDGQISASEYSGNTYTTSDGGQWYMTWNGTNLYVAKTGGKTDEPTFLYLDLDPQLPVTSGGNARGNTVGNLDYSVTPSLPFRADARVIFSNNSVEVRRRDSSGGWGAPLTNSNSDITIYSDGTNREVRLNWSVLTGMPSATAFIPPSFNWLGYATNKGEGANNFRYDQAPVNMAAAGTDGNDIINPATGRPAPPMTYYYTVANTADGVAATRPFSLRSYTFVSNNNINDFGAIDVWDFTLNSVNQQITRSSGDWNIRGSLVVGSGTLFFGLNGPFGATTVGNLRVTGGRLDMNQATQPLRVTNDVYLSGGQTVLSGAINGDLIVGRDFRVENGTADPLTATFQPVGRTVVFSGNTAHSLNATGRPSEANYLVSFNYLTLSSGSNGSVSLASDIQVVNQLNFDQGNLLTNTYTVFLAADAKLGDINSATPQYLEKERSHIIGQVQITQPVGSGGDPTADFGNSGFILVPQRGSTSLGNVTVRRTTVAPLTGPNSSTSIRRYFKVDFSTPGTTVNGLDVKLLFAYRLDELNTNMSESRLVLFKAPTSTGPFTPVPSTTDLAVHTLTVDPLTSLTSGDYFTAGDSNNPLPVTLVSFTATSTAQGAASLRWLTASELHNKGFGIERQLGNKAAWQSVGYVAASGQLTGSTYTFVDKGLATAPATANAYYRLRQEDQDGTITYSPVAVIMRQTALATSELQLSPVPVTGSSLSVALAEAGQAGLEVAITNTQGQRLLHFTTQASPDAALSLPVAQLTAGVYFVTVQVPGQPVRHARFVKL